MSDATQRFGDRADAYAAHRPSYPPEAIDVVLAGLGDPHALTIADLGAGTGISSRLLAERGAKVIAIEPNARMRAAAGLDAGIEWRDGTGEASGLPSASVDLAAAFQAFHWFATPAGVAEMRRIATRRAALVQYERDARDPFTSAYGDASVDSRNSTARTAAQPRCARLRHSRARGRHAPSSRRRSG